MHSRRLIYAAAVLACAVAWSGTASADLSRGVITALRGELIVTKGDLPEGKNEKDTVAKIKGERLKELTGDAREDVVYWHFHYTAFLSKPGATQLKMEFWSPDKKFAADNRLEGVDPKSEVLSGDISISEEDGLSKGKSYTIKLVNDKDVIVAQAQLVMK